MKKHVPSKISMNSKPSGSPTISNFNDSVTRGLFTFPNGDKYEGEYRIYGEELLLVRQGQGIYYTDDFNIYEAAWERDRLSDNLWIRFNNGMKYTGHLDNNGSMCGPGTYFFPDGSSISAIWNNNKPSIDIRYKEPLGFVWKGEIFEDGNVSDKKEIIYRFIIISRLIFRRFDLRPEIISGTTCAHGTIRNLREEKKFLIIFQGHESFEVFKT